MRRSAPQRAASDGTAFPPCDDENSVARRDFIRVETEVGCAGLGVIARKLLVELGDQRRPDRARQRFRYYLELIRPHVFDHDRVSLNCYE